MTFRGGYYGEDGPVEIVHDPIYCDICGYYHSPTCDEEDECDR
jgi:hypothetical protein